MQNFSFDREEIFSSAFNQNHEFVECDADVQWNCEKNACDSWNVCVLIFPFPFRYGRNVIFRKKIKSKTFTNIAMHRTYFHKTETKIKRKHLIRLTK